MAGKHRGLILDTGPAESLAVDPASTVEAPRAAPCRYHPACIYQACGMTPVGAGWVTVCFYHSERDNLVVKPLDWTG